jgi:polygalacturonase
MFVVVARATALWFVLQTVLATTFNVLDYGAIGDGVTVDTVAIQTALLKASQDGGGIVLLPANRTFMSGSLHLQNNTIFRIETGATLLGSPVSL